jgi:hypothetical protein
VKGVASCFFCCWGVWAGRVVGVVAGGGAADEAGLIETSNSRIRAMRGFTFT